MSLKVKTATITAIVDGMEKAVKILIVDESESPAEEDISIGFNNGTATIRGLNNLNVSYSGTTAIIGR